jgi:crotonobetainyl-CoA:carnitine CoA-transferase CaiB-like acyl-CoA transferase
MSTPLEGVRVLDLSRVFAGPVAGRMLADLGADVVKVEPPEGDVTRTFGRGPQTAYFRQQNAGKRAITVDLTTTEGRDLVRRLAARADIVLENFRPGVLARFGLGWDDLSAAHPGLIMLSISGFGQDGPERDRAAYAGVIHAEMGVIARQPGRDDLPHTDLPISMADVVSGLHGLVGILAALRHRDVTGEGNHIDLAMVDALLASDDVAPTLMGAGRADGANMTEIVDAPGGPLVVMGEFKWIWKSIHERLGVPDPCGPDADIPTKARLRRLAWQELVGGFTTRAELTAALDRANLAWGVVRHTSEALDSPTMRHRGTFVELTDDDGSTYNVVRSPYRFSNADSGVRGPAPRPDQHRAEILADWLSEA